MTRRGPFAASPRQVATAVRDACIAEIHALKPGNVHIHAPGHDMTVEQFLVSAEVIAAPLSDPGLSVGQRIWRAVEATRATVGCNTNLGIVLLAAPLAHAALVPGIADLRRRTAETLAALTVEDSMLAYRAIRLAAPGGLGASARHDVAARPTVTLLTAMTEARERDRIARQYATAFADVFGLGVTRARLATVRFQAREPVATAVHLGFLARFPDTHVERKHGRAVAEAVRHLAVPHAEAVLAEGLDADRERALLFLDATLKAYRINPGTTADLTVASLLAAGLEDIISAAA